MVPAAAMVQHDSFRREREEAKADDQASVGWHVPGPLAARRRSISAACSALIATSSACCSRNCFSSSSSCVSCVRQFSLDIVEGAAAELHSDSDCQARCSLTVLRRVGGSPTRIAKQLWMIVSRLEAAGRGQRRHVPVLGQTETGRFGVLVELAAGTKSRASRRDTSCVTLSSGPAVAGGTAES